MCVAFSLRPTAPDMSDIDPLGLDDPTNRRALKRNAKARYVAAELFDCILALLDTVSSSYAAIAEWFTRRIVYAVLGWKLRLLLPAVVSYADLASDSALAVTLLNVASPVFGLSYGVLSFAIIAFSIITEIVFVRLAYPAPFLSKEMFLAVVGLTPLSLVFCNVTFPHDKVLPKGDDSAKRMVLSSIMAFFKAFTESVPELVLQIFLLSSSTEGWSSPLALVSLSITIFAVGTAMASSEASLSGFSGRDVKKARNVKHRDYSYLCGPQRYILVLLLACFIASYLTMSTSALVLAMNLFPLWMVAGIQFLDATVHHISKVSEYGLKRHHAAGPVMLTINLFLRSADWLAVKFCPLPLLRNPCKDGSVKMGPSNFARTVVFTLLESGFVICYALLQADFLDFLHGADTTLDNHTATGNQTAQQFLHEEPLRLLVQWVAFPALCLALVSLMAFLALLDPQCRVTFWKHDTMKAVFQRHFDHCLGQPDGDGQTADVVSRLIDKLHRSPIDMPFWNLDVDHYVVLWIEQSATSWADAPQSWCTEAWHAKVEKHANLIMSNEVTARLLAALPPPIPPLTA